VRAIHLSLVQKLSLLYSRSFLIRLMIFCLAGLIVMSLILHVVEWWSNPESEYGKSYFATVVNILILFMSGFDADRPDTVVGKIAAFSALILGICFLGMFTGEVASWLVERRLKGNRGMKPVTFSDHIIITRWSKDTEAIIDELMSGEIKVKRQIVVIDRELAELPITNPLVEFVRGDPTEGAVLERAGVMRANTAIILADTSTADYNAEDSRNILTCLAIESMHKGVYTVVQVLNPSNVKHLERAGCDEIICTTEISTRLVVQSSLNHGLSKMFSDILSFGEGSEIYRVKLAKRFAGKEYFELGAELMQKHRISLLALESDGEMHINPKDPVSVKEGDLAFVLAEDHPDQIEE